MQRSLYDWLNYIGSIHSSAIDLGLSRIQPIAQQLNLTTFPCAVVTVGRTNGKGSIVRTLECMALEAGYRVGAYTSPHLLHFNERLRINDKVLNDSCWITAFSTIEQVRDQALSFFEYTTLAALLICRSYELDLLILEVGLGGRLDAVNVVDSDVAVISNIDIDHIEWLGDNREQIAAEKAGIFRAGKPAVCGDSNPPLSLLNAASERHVQLYCFERDYFFSNTVNGGLWRGPGKTWFALPRPNLKPQNVASALMALECLALQFDYAAVERGIARANLPGRYEQVQKVCKIIYDVAHNPQSACYLAQRLAEETVDGQIYAVFAMLHDKDITNTIRPLCSLIDQWYVADLDLPRGAKSTELTTYLLAEGVKSYYTFCTVKDATKAALAVCHPHDILLVFGSFHTVAATKEYINTELASA